MTVTMTKRDKGKDRDKEKERQMSTVVWWVIGTTMLIDLLIGRSSVVGGFSVHKLVIVNTKTCSLSVEQKRKSWRSSQTPNLRALGSI